MADLKELEVKSQVLYNVFHNLEELEWAKYRGSLEVKSQQEAVPIQYDVLQDNVQILVLSLQNFGVDITDIFTKAEEVFDYIQHQPNMSIGSITSHQLVEELTINHNSPLHVACLLGNLGMVEKVSCCNYIDCTNKVGDTPLHIACRLGHEDICEYISGQIVADSNGSLVGSKTLPELYIDDGLYYKEYTGKVLVSANLPSIFTENEEKLTPFQVALRFQNYSCMSIVLSLPKFHLILCRKSMAFIDLSSEQSLEHVSSGTPGGMVISRQLYNEYLKKCTDVLHDYRQRNYTQIIATVRLNALYKNDKGQFPIESLMENYDKVDDTVDLVKNIVKHSACFWHNVIKADSKKFFSFCSTHKLFEPEIWKHLCHTKDQNDNLLLHLICRYSDDATIVKCFCQCEINTKNVSGCTPLHEAFLYNNYSVCRWLVLDRQCDVFNEYKSYNSTLCEKIHVPSFEVTEVTPGDTLLHVAAASGSSDAVSYLIGYVKLNTLNSRQQYPLHVACKSGLSIEAIHLLRECDITNKDVDGNTPLDLLYKHHPNRQDLMACAMGSSYYIPGETFSPCSKEELVSTEWFYDLSFQELEQHHNLHNNALHIAADNESIVLIEELKEDYPDLFHKFVLEKNLYHYLPLHYAALNRNINSIKLLSKGCDVNSVNKLGHTCLHEACRSASNSENDLEVVRFLIEDLKVDVNIGNNIGRTALHLGCKRGKTRIVKYIVTMTTANPDIKDGNNCTPLMLTSLDNHDIIKLLIEHGADTSPLYDTYKEFFKTYQSENPPPTPLNIIVAGKPSSGKSTLIKALCSDGSQTIVQAEPHTAGIIPSSHDSEELGCVSFYDLAGQSEYYASHEAVLHTVMASSTPLILLLVDCRKNQGLILQDILYWLHFFKCQVKSKSEDGQPHVIVAFSFADQIQHQIAQMKANCSKDALKHIFSNSGFHLAHCNFLDCRMSYSNELKELREDINTCASVLRSSAPINFLLHCFYAFLLRSFNLQPAVQISDIINIKEQWISSGMDPNMFPVSDSDSSLSSSEEFDFENEPTFEEENPAYLLPDNSDSFVKLSKKLHQKGHVIFLQNHKNITHSWLVINKEILLHEINGSLFAPPASQHYQGIVNTSTGVVASSAIEKQFPHYDIKMLIGFLLHLEYCQKITDSSILELLSAELQFSSDEFYYFPGLVRIEKPQNVWNSLAGPVVQCGWILRVEDATSFFTPRLIQILILRVAFQNAFPVKSWNRGFKCPSICRSCCVWKNGIFWRNEVGTECLLEVAEQSQAVVLMFRSLKVNLQNNNLKKLLFVRSSMIRTVLKCAEEICPSLNVLEYFCHPDQVQYPPKPCEEMALYSINNIAKAVCQRSEIVMCDNPSFDNLKLSELLHFEPFMSCCFKEMFDDANQNNLISENDMETISECVKSERMFIALSDRDGESADGVILTWKSKTYRELRCQLAKFSVFGSRNLQVSK